MEFGVWLSSCSGTGGVQAQAFHSCLKEPRIRSLMAYSTSHVSNLMSILSSDHSESLTWKVWFIKLNEGLRVNN